jgi:hypothetical protein
MLTNYALPVQTTTKVQLPVLGLLSFLHTSFWYYDICCIYFLSIFCYNRLASENSENFYQTTRRWPEDSHMHTRRRENLKSHKIKVLSKPYWKYSVTIGNFLLPDKRKDPDRTWPMQHKQLSFGSSFWWTCLSKHPSLLSRAHRTCSQS